MSSIALWIVRRKFASTALWLLVLCGGMTVSLHTTQAADFTPPDRGAPGRLIGGGTRFQPPEGETSTRRVPKNPLVESNANQSFAALVPEDGYGLTLTANPTFYAYIPATPQATVEFVLTEGGTELLRTTLTPPNASSIIAIELPALAVDKVYYWHLEVASSTLPRGKVQLNGWIERAAATPEFATAIAQASPLDRVALYAEAGLWFDALNTLVDLRLAASNPQESAQLASEWQQLLDSVGLRNLPQDAVPQ